MGAGQRLDHTPDVVPALQVLRRLRALGIACLGMGNVLHCTSGSDVGLDCGDALTDQLCHLSATKAAEGIGRACDFEHGRAKSIGFSLERLTTSDDVAGAFAGPSHRNTWHERREVGAHSLPLHQQEGRCDFDD